MTFICFFTALSLAASIELPREPIRSASLSDIDEKKCYNDVINYVRCVYDDDLKLLNDEKPQKIPVDSNDSNHKYNNNINININNEINGKSGAKAVKDLDYCKSAANVTKIDYANDRIEFEEWTYSGSFCPEKSSRYTIYVEGRKSIQLYFDNSLILQHTAKVTTCLERFSSKSLTLNLIGHRCYPFNLSVRTGCKSNFYPGAKFSITTDNSNSNENENVYPSSMANDPFGHYVSCQTSECYFGYSGKNCEIYNGATQTPNQTSIPTPPEPTQEQPPPKRTPGPTGQIPAPTDNKDEEPSKKTPLPPNKRETMTMVKSKKMSHSFFHTGTMMPNGVYSETMYGSYVISYSYYEQNIEINIVENEQTVTSQLSSGMIIMIASVSVAITFILIGIVVFLIRKKNENLNFDENDFSDSDGGYSKKTLHQSMMTEHGESDLWM